MAQIYEAMFLLDNQVVREDWGKAKAIVTDTLEKHGATIHDVRRPPDDLTVSRNIAKDTPCFRVLVLEDELIWMEEGVVPMS